MRFTILTNISEIRLTICILAISFAGIGLPKQLLAQGKIDFKIDSTIKQLVEAKISDKGYEHFADDMMLFYENAVIADYYEGDSLLVSTKGENRTMVFRSFYYSIGDTLSIDGLFGLFGGIGFSVKLVNDDAEVFHLLASDDFPEYSITENGELEYRIEVPCTNTRLILSQRPSTKESEFVYGMVEFSSGEYFHGIATFDGEELENRNRRRVDMKIYFKSKYLDIERLK